MSTVGVPGVILAGGARSHQENYAAAFAAAGCQLLAVAVADGLDEAEMSRHAELAQSLALPLLPLDQAVALPGATIASTCVSLAHRARVAAICAEAGLDRYLDKPLAGSASRLCSFSRWQYPMSRPALWPSQIRDASPLSE